MALALYLIVSLRSVIYQPKIMTVRIQYNNPKPCLSFSGPLYYHTVFIYYATRLKPRRAEH